MLSSHFVLFEDETFPSIGNRIWARAGYSSAHAFSHSHSSLGTQELWWSRIPGGLEAVASVLRVAPSFLLQHHTMAPYYEATYPSPTLGDGHMGVEEGRVDRQRYSGCGEPRQPLRFCLACVNEDVAAVGEPYWRRAHQLPGVLVCHRHHRWLVSECARCGWRPSRKSFSYPGLRCPDGHSLLSVKPVAAGALAVEVKFAQWSHELLAYQAGSRHLPLSVVLRNLATDLGLRGPGWKLSERALQQHVREHRHPALSAGLAFVHRASFRAQRHIISLATQGVFPQYPHPAAVLMCVKGLLGPDANVIQCLSTSSEMKRTVSGSWSVIPKGDSEERKRFLVEHALARVGDDSESSISRLERAIGEELGVQRTVVNHYVRKFPEFKESLTRVRPDLYRPALSKEDRLLEVVDEVRELVDGVDVRSARQLELLFAEVEGVRLETVRAYKRRYSKMAAGLKEIRPHLYVQQTMTLRLFDRLRYFPHVLQGEGRREFERRLAEWLGVTPKRISAFKTMCPGFEEHLKSARPELYKVPRRKRLTREEILRCIVDFGRNVHGDTISEFEGNFAGLLSRGGSRVAKWRKSSPEVAAALKTLRPDLYP